MDNTLKIKVCGMRQINNIQAVLDLGIDYMGFIFFEKSARHVDEEAEQQLHLSFQNIDFQNTKKVGVFVNSNLDDIIDKVNRLQLHLIQLHGTESVDFCQKLRNQLNDRSIQIIKVFSVDDRFDFDATIQYIPVCDYFLFDTKGKNHGGNGVQFNWDILKNYNGETPFFLSGGIGKDDAQMIKAIHHPQLFALDINSKFETEPALKDVERLAFFTTNLSDSRVGLR